MVVDRCLCLRGCEVVAWERGGKIRERGDSGRQMLVLLGWMGS